MSIKSTSTDHTTSEINDETSSSEEQKRQSSKKTTKKESIKNYVTGVLTKHDNDDEQPTDSTSTQIEIATSPDVFRDYENISAFRRYQSTTERPQDPSSTSEDEIHAQVPTEEVRHKKKLINRLFCLIFFS